MRLYRNHYYTSQDSSQGFAWFTSKKDAERAFSEKVADGTTDDIEEDIDLAEKAKPFDIDTRRNGLARFLDSVSHPDNG